MDNNLISNFGKYVFDDREMKRRLPGEVYRKLRNVIEHGGELDVAAADIIAH